MNYTIESHTCLNNKCPTKLATLLLSLATESNNEAMVKLGIKNDLITFKSTSPTKEFDKLTLTEKGIKYIEKILIESDLEMKSKSKAVRDYDTLANKMREVYPSGKKAGTAYQWKDSTNIISLRLKALDKKYTGCLDKYTDEQIVQATRNYVNSFNGSYTYMQLLKYFIMKNDMADRANDASQLLAYLDNIGQEDIVDAEFGTLL